jgi:hypothetical protein
MKLLPEFGKMLDGASEDIYGPNALKREKRAKEERKKKALEMVDKVSSKKIQAKLKSAFTGRGEPNLNDLTPEQKKEYDKHHALIKKSLKEGTVVENIIEKYLS